MAEMFKQDEQKMVTAIIEHEEERQSLLLSAIEKAEDVSEAIRRRDLSYESDCEIRDEMMAFFRILDACKDHE